jgi:hypothetical protein
MRLVLLLLVAVPLFAQSEICRFPAGDPIDPFKRWLISQELTCVAATPRVEIPAGLWNVFAKSNAELSPPLLVQGGTSFDAASLQKGPAATITVQLPEGHSGVVYVPRRATAFPVSGTRTQVPAGEQLWLLVLDKSHAVTSIVTVASLEAGTERTVDARTGGLTSVLLASLRVAEEDREPLRNAGGGVLPPEVRITSGGSSYDADPLPPPASLDGAFVLMRGASAGDAEIQIGGRGWLPYRTRVSVGSRNVTAITTPLLVRPAASLIVSFSTGVDVVALDRSLGSCDPSKDKPPVFEISVLACPEPPRGKDLDPEACQLIRQQPFGAEVPYGSFAVDDVAPGTYRAVMRFGKLPPVSSMATVQALQQSPVRISATYSSVYGSLRLGGEPAGQDAVIAFPNGGVGFASKETGEYRAVLLDHRIDSDARLDIVACEGDLNAFVLTDRHVTPFSRFDIDIPDNSISVHVTDTFTRMALRQATLKYVVLSQSGQPLVTETVTSDPLMPNRFVMEHVPERRIELTVSHSGYEKYRVERFTMPKREHKTIDVQMVPLRGSRGRIVSPMPFDEATVNWQSASGRGGETVELAPDGTFFYERAHEAGEIMTIVSKSHPLWVLRMPALAPRQSLDLRFPDAPVREFTVRLDGADARKPTSIGLAIGDLVVPAGALFLHQSLRGSSVSLIPDKRLFLPFRDILETGPIELFAGPASSPRKRLTPGVTELVLSLPPPL